MYSNTEWISLLSSFVIIIASMLSFSYSEYMEQHDTPTYETTPYYVSMILLIVGWCGLLYNLKPSRPILLSSILVIVTSVYFIYEEMQLRIGKIDNRHQTPVVINVLGWILFGFMMGHQTRQGLVAGLLMAFSIHYLLPSQRDAQIVDGSGYLIITLVWVYLFQLHSSTKGMAEINSLNKTAWA